MDAMIDANSIVALLENAKYILYDYKGADSIPLPENCKATASPREILSEPKHKKVKLEVIEEAADIVFPATDWGCLPVRETITSVFFDGVNSPWSVDQNEFYGDLLRLLGSVTHVAQFSAKEDNGLHKVLSAWFPSGIETIQLGALHVKEGKCIFIDHFCSRLNIASTKPTTVAKLLNLWDCTAKLIISGKQKYLLPEHILMCNLNNFFRDRGPLPQEGPPEFDSGRVSKRIYTCCPSFRDASSDVFVDGLQRNARQDVLPPRNILQQGVRKRAMHSRRRRRFELTCPKHGCESLHNIT